MFRYLFTAKKVEIQLIRAMYGEAGNPKKQIDIRDKLQGLIDAKEYSFQVTNQFAGRDPARGIPKALVLEYRLNGKKIVATIQENRAYSLVSIRD